MKRVLILFLFLQLSLVIYAQQKPAKEKSAKSSQLNIDFAKVSPDKCTVLLENEHVRVLRYTLAPGEKDNPHTHPPRTSYVLSGGTLRVYPEGKAAIDFLEVAGTSDWSDYVGKHYVENIGTTTVTILLTEIKPTH